MRRLLVALFFPVLFVFASSVLAQPGKELPVLKIKTFGPSSYVSSLAFSPDGKTLYAGGWDKVIRVWQLNEESGRFDYMADRAFRLPIGPGLFGGVNAISISGDGRWLAVAGRWPMRGLAGFRDKTASLLPSATLTESQRLDSGSIYVFNTDDRTSRVLRGHNAPVVSMEFAAGSEQPVLVSAAERALAKGVGGSIRAWSISDSKLIAKLERVPVPGPGGPPTQWTWQNLPGLAGQTPGLAVWSTGAAAKNIRVAFAWGDNDANSRRGKFRVWDVNTGQVSTSDTGSYPLVVKTLNAVSGGQRLLAAAHRELGLWTVFSSRNGSLAALSRSQDFTNIPHLGVRNLPTRAALFSTRAGGPLDTAALVVQNQSERTTARLELQLVDLVKREPRGERILIQQGALSELKQPSVAATGQGSYLAVAGSRDDSIRVYAIDKLLAGDRRDPQILSGTGTTWQRVAFVKKGDALGVELETTIANQPRRLTFDISNRTVVGNPAGWQPAEAPAAQWRAAFDSATRQVRVFNNNQPLPTRITIPAGRPVTAVAVVPPSDHANVSLVAVATHRLGEPRLSLYDGASGKELRQFAGHLERIRDLAFSADGRLLASVADDRTLRLWWIADIDETRGKLGRVSGLLVEERGDQNQLTVSRIDAGSQAAGKLFPGEVIVSAQTKEGPATFKTRFEFYEFLGRNAPGSAVALKISRRGQERAVELTTDQGVDQRNPLFSLFLNPQDRNGDVSWIGWNPIGPYDVSNRNAERFLGWHFNTGNPNSPTRFASADQYRNNYDEGLLKRLIDKGPTGVARPPEPPPKLNMNVSLVAKNGDTWTAGYDDGAIIREQNHELLIKIEKFPLNRLKSILWKLDDGAAQPLKAGEGSGVFAVRLPELKRGNHTVTVTPIATNPTDSYPARSMKFRFLQPKPVISFDTATLPESTNKPTVTLKATVTNRQAAGAVEVEFELNDRTMANLTVKAGETLKINREVTLAEGKNSIRLQARNADAIAGSLRDETAAVTKWVYYERVPEPPVITIAQVLNSEDGRRLPMKTTSPADGQSVLRRLITTNSAQITVRGKVAGPDPLADIRFVRSGVKQETVPARFAANKVKQFEFNEKLSLIPGRQTITIRAQTTRAKQAEESIVVEYRPVLPTITQVSVQTTPKAKPQILLPDNDVDLIRGTHPQTVTLRLVVEHPQEAHAAGAQLEINGQQVGNPLVITPDITELSQQVTLLPGTNSVQFKISSLWSAGAETSPAVTVNYLRPPVIAGLNPPPNAESQLPDHKGKPFFDFSVNVNCDANRPLSSFVATINNVAAATDTVSIEQDATDKTVWKVSIRNAPLDQGENRIRLLARNDDGASKPVEFTIRQLAPASKPQIVLVSPKGTNTRATSTDYVAEFKVRSESDLTRVDLIVASKESLTTKRIPLIQNATKTGEPNLYRFTKVVQLQRGVNQLSLEAFNEGGRTTVETVVNVVLPPITIVLDEVIPEGAPDQKVVRSQPRTDGIHFLDAAPNGHVKIRGHVEWSVDRQARKEIADARIVRVWINGFLRMARLRPIAEQPDRAAFEVEAVLNRKENQIEFEHAALPVRDDNRSYYLSCTEPERKQHLHLVMVGVRKLAKRRPVSSSLIEKHAKQALTSSVAANAFARIEEYRTLAGPDAISGRIKAELNAVVNRINARVRRRQYNDVVVIYYHGKEIITKSGEFRLADYRNWHNPAIDRASISSTYLSNMLNNQIPGAHLVLLDVNHIGPKLTRNWPQEPHLGVLRISNIDELRLLSQLEKSRPTPQAGNDIQLKQIELALQQLNRTDTQPSFLDTNVPVTLEDLVLGAAE